MLALAPAVAKEVDAVHGPLQHQEHLKEEMVPVQQLHVSSGSCRVLRELLHDGHFCGDSVSISVLSEADVSSGDAFDGNPREKSPFFKTRQLMIGRARVQLRARVGVVDKEEGLTGK